MGENESHTTESTEISIDCLRLDPDNPRLPSRLGRGREDRILHWMLVNSSVTDLIRSIGEQGYFNGEPLLVVPLDDSNYTVVEGNRRLAALKLLRDPARATFRKATISTLVDEAREKIPSTVPCIIYDSRDEILEYLGFRHVTGIKSWGPLSKARYLQDLSTSAQYENVEGDEKYRQLAKVIGSRMDYVKRILAGLKLYDDIAQQGFYNIEKLDETTLSFSLITTALANRHIVEFLGLESAQDLTQSDLNHPQLEELTRWAFERDHDGNTRLGESRRIKDLNRVVEKPAALEQFRKGRSLDEALIYTGLPVESYRLLLQKAKTNISDAQIQLNQVREGLTEYDEVILDDINILIQDVSNILKGRLEQFRDADKENVD